MHFRSRKKSAQDVSLSDYIETGSDGTALSLMDVVSEDCDLMEQVMNKELAAQLHQAVKSCLTEQERQVIALRYGLSGQEPQRQREVAAMTGISRSYVSRRAYCKRRNREICAFRADRNAKKDHDRKSKICEEYMKHHLTKVGKDVRIRLKDLFCFER